MPDPQPRPIREIADRLGITDEHFIPYGHDRAKVDLAARSKDARFGRLVLVSAMTPTAAGEGKTTTAIGLSQGFQAIGERVAVALREPSLGPTMGSKGGGTGGGRSQLVPAVDINLHFNGDLHAISAANNLLAAALDNSLMHGNPLGIDPRRVLWRRVIDLNDRALRNTLIGLGGVLQGVPRETGFDITPASEVMAALCLAEGEADLRRRLGRLLVALTYDREPVTAADLEAVGAMMVILKDALHPNLAQTSEGVPAFIHGGPFANIAHGCNSVLATKMALAHSPWVVTEAGFASDLGAEKFFDIKCVSAGLDVAAVVLVATARALKLHGGAKKRELAEPDPAAVERGLVNLAKHVENVRAFGREPVIALNRFTTDTDDEVAVVERAAASMKVPFAVSEGVTLGGAGCARLAEVVREHASQASAPFQPLYDWDEPFRDKMERIARRMYGASEVTYDQKAKKDLRILARLGLESLPLCVAKTPMSLSANPSKIGRPEGFEVTVRRVVAAAGAGFVVPLLGDILRMPGLPKSPQLKRIDLVDGEVRGLR